MIGSGFNGASLLDFGHDTGSLIMALIAFAAIGSYAAAQFQLSVALSDAEGVSARAG